MPKDKNQIAARIVAMTTGQEPPVLTKNPAAVALGRLGGLKGGKARAEKLSASRRKDIARKAIAARWMTIKKTLTDPTEEQKGELLKKMKKRGYRLSKEYSQITFNGPKTYVLTFQRNQSTRIGAPEES